jgi:hypothetical protein
MRPATSVLLAAMLLLCGCEFKGERRQPQAVVKTDSAAPSPLMPQAQAPSKPISEAASRATAEISDRKIIRNAEITIEIDSPAEGKRKIEAIAEAHGGFVVASEVTDHGDDEAGAQTIVTVIVRIPAPRFSAVVDEIRKVGRRVRREKISGQDVTEEYFDLEARLKAKKALEAQYLEILKQAKNVTDALEVQKVLAEVRGEIEQMEGRHRFLENQVNLSTVTVTLQTPAPLVGTSASGFFQRLKRAFGDGFDAALEIVLWLIRLVLALIPIVLFVVLPAVYLWPRLRRRRAHAPKPPAPNKGAAADLEHQAHN